MKDSLNELEAKDSDRTQKETNTIASENLSAEAQLKLEIIQNLQEPCDRKTYGKKLKEAAEKLGKSVRTVQRLVRQWEQEGLTQILHQKKLMGITEG